METASISDLPKSDLPSWDLSDLYKSPTCDELVNDKAILLDLVEDFAKKYHHKIATCSIDELLKAMVSYEAILELTAKLSSYADLIYATQTTNVEIAKHYQDIGDFVNECSSQIVFFTLELSQLDKTKLNGAILQQFQPWINDVVAYLPYQLNEDLERIILEKQSVSNGSWLRLYEDICNRMVCEINGNNLTLSEALDLLSHNNADTRKLAAEALSLAFNEKIETFSLIFNVIIKDKQIDDAWRGFKKPASSRNLSNLVEDEIVDKLVRSVQANYSALSEKYYRWKAKKLGKSQLDFWDRNAPLPYDDDKYITWEEAKTIVLQAYGDFSPQMAEIAESFFANNWIDAPVIVGKTSGAFSHPCATTIHPYILLNYQGKMQDVMTLAHELGHGVHQILAAKQGALMADTPLTLAETASVFAEQLTFQYLLKNEQNPQLRQNLIAGKIEDMLNTVVRQIAFYQFESQAHEMRKNGELTPTQISEIWLQTQAESFGDAVALDEKYAPFWAYISHFYHSPFYVYAYAFGDCLVNSLYAIYAEGAHSDFEAKYLQMLSAGGSLRHKELLAPFGLNIAEDDFWQKGLNYIAKLIDMLDD